MSIPYQQSQYGHNPPAYLGSSPMYPGTNTMTPEKHPQSRVDEIPPVGTAQTTEEAPKKSLKSRILFWFSFFAGVLWLVPVGYLLYLNFSKKVIGASAWCPGGDCSVITYSGEIVEDETQTTFMKAFKFSKHDHNLLGVLQFVAKILEIWFIAITASLVYTLSRILATRPGGLPLGHLLAHVEFADILNLTKSSLYTSVKHYKGSTATRKSRRRMFILFVTVVVFLCILANTIGPMTAVLLLPTLEPDYQTPKISADRFQQVRSSYFPSNGNKDTGKFSACNDTELEAGDYICFLAFYGYTLDDLIDETLAFMDQEILTDAPASVQFPINFTPTLEGNFPFSFNTSVNIKQNFGPISWATSRQVVRELSGDFSDFAQVVLGNSDNKNYEIAKNSLSVTLQREAPIIGFQSLSSWGNITILQVDDSRTIHCINEYQPVSGTENEWYSKCFRYGAGWNLTALETDFVVDLDQDQNITVLGYWSDQSTYFYGSGVRLWDDCFQNEVISDTTLTVQDPPNCDWDRLFAQDFPADLPQMSHDAFVLEFWNWDSEEPRVLVYEIHPFVGKADYSVDVTQVYPQVSEVRIERLPQDDEISPIVIHPGWLLATWGIPIGNSTRGYNISSTDGFATASSAGKLKTAVNELYEIIFGDIGYDYNGNDYNLYYEDRYNRWSNITQNMALQMLSMVTYDTTTDQFPSHDKLHPDMSTSMRLKLWQWGAGSRTAKVGVVITLIACAVIIVRSVVILFDRSPKLSTLGIVASLMEHAHNGELQHVPPTQRQAAGMVRFKMHGLHEDKLVFQQP